MRRPILVANRLPVTIGVDPDTGKQTLLTASAFGYRASASA